MLDREGGNGIFLASHDASMEAKIFKTVQSVPAILQNNVFWQIFVNLEEDTECRNQQRREVYN